MIRKERYIFREIAKRFAKETSLMKKWLTIIEVDSISIYVTHNVIDVSEVISVTDSHNHSQTIFVKIMF